MKSDYIIKKYLLPVICMFFMQVTIQAQNTPVPGVRPVAIPVPVPVYSNPALNFVRVYEPDMAIQDTAVVASSARSTTEVKQAIQYFDGLGRPMQSITKGISTGGKDMVVPITYDTLGHERYKYLPYVQQTGNYNDGRFKSDPFNSQKNFYKTDALNPGITGDSIYYAQTEYELSPLNRVLKTYAPGNSWAKEGGNRPVEGRYLQNRLTDSVRIWTLNANIPATTNIYSDGELFKNVLIDEAGSQVIEYKDKEEHVILKKVQISDVADTVRAHANWLCTYYVYDNFGRLRFVIPPLAVEQIKGSWNITTSLADELCFQYQYDNRNRMIVKKIPGMGAVNMVYDTRDRLVFTQDSIQRKQSPQEWLVTFYDVLDRPSVTALYKANTSRSLLQSSMDTVSAGTKNLSQTFPAVADLALDSYNGDSAYVATKSILFVDAFDSGIGAGFQTYIDSTITGTTTTITVSNPLPGITPDALTPLTYMFYDTYDFPGKFNYENGEAANLRATNNPYAEALPSVASAMTRGLVTGNKVRVLGTEQWLTTTSYYDNKGRVIQVVSDNNVGGKDIATNQYDFSGKLLSSFLRHKNPRSNVTPQTTLLTMMSYDHAGRLLNITKRLNGDSTQERIIAANSYNELGELTKKRLGALKTGGQLDTISYLYNVRGWLSGINRPFVNNNSGNDNWFGEELNYDYGFLQSQYNGNIAGVKWKSKSNNIARAYGYDYDKVNRLKTADFTQQNNGATTWLGDQVNFSVSNLSYDANGNIVTMKQVGMVGTAIDTIDKLTYTYAPGSNKLTAVADPSNTATAKLGDFINGTNTGDDYSYDGNGNLVTDLNKGISAITYNYLNLPVNILITGKGSISYQYDATGNKLKKTVVDNTGSPAKTTVTDYIGGFSYKQDTLQYVSHEEGRIRPVYQTGQPVKFKYDYFEKDHLGNTRVVLTDQTDFSMYTATMETAAAAKETALFSNVEETRAEKPVGYPEDTAQNAFVSKLNAKAGGKKIGPSLVLRVMAGDTVKIHARAFYKSIGPKDKPKQHPAEEMVAGLLQAFGGHPDDEMHGAAINNNSPLNGSFNNKDYEHLKEKDPDEMGTDRPKAYLNFVLFDDQFKLVDENSGVRQVKSAPDELQELGVDELVAAKSGFLYVYTSNEVEQDVFFDNVNVALMSGPLLEETHYYPFGLTMAGISSNALKGMNYPENRTKYQSQVIDNELNLDWYQFKWRNHDPQIGRFIEVDPLSSKYEYNSPYAFSENQVTAHIELEGLEKWSIKNGIGKTQYVYGPYRNQATAQKYFDDNLTTNGRVFNTQDGFVQNNRVATNRVEALERGKIGSVDGIVLHRTASSSTDGTIRSFENGRDGVNYGTHFLVGTSGEILQTASLGSYTLHVGKVRDRAYPTNSHAIGIEVVGMYNGDTQAWDPLTKDQTTSVAFLTNSLKLSYNLTNNQVYNHEDISYKTAGEGQVVRTAIEPYIAPSTSKQSTNNIWWMQYLNN